MRKNKGITLIALIITIIVMLILVGVVVTVVIQSDLLGTAKNAGDEYKGAYVDESNMNNVAINQKEYNSIEEYMEEINKVIVEPENIGDWGYVVEDDGTITLNYYKGKDTEVVIPNYINGIPVKKIGYTMHSQYNQPYQGAGIGSFWDFSICSGDIEWYWGIQKTITKVVITDGIEEIHPYAFCGMQVVEEFVLPKSLKNFSVLNLKWRPYANNITTNTRVIIPFSKEQVPESWTIPNDNSCEEYEMKLEYLEK